MQPNFESEIKNKLNMSNKIGFTNFRKFANFPEIDLGDVTVLVGGNNSGKSTLVKAFLLCVDNLRMMRMSDRRREFRNNIFGFNKPIFRFDANEYHDVKVKTFARAIHNKLIENGNGEGSSLPSTITFKFAIGKFEFKFVVAGDRDEELTYGDVQLISIEDKEQNIRFCNDYEHGTMSYAVLASSKGGDSETVQDDSKKDGMKKEYQEIEKSLDTAKEEGDLEKIASLSEVKERIEVAYKKAFGVDVASAGNLEGANHEEDAPTSQKKESVCYDNLPLGFDLNEVNEPVVKNVISNIINFASMSKDQAPVYKEGEDLDAYNEKLEEYQAQEDARKDMYLDISKMRKSRNDLAYLLGTLDVQYISAHAVNQDAYYKTGSNDFMAQVVYDFYFERIVPGDTEYTFVTDWMKTFDIGHDFCIEPLMAGDVYKLTIEDEDGMKLPLADKGMGAIQMMMLLLRLATIMRRAKSNKSAATTVVIEEPEQNLHPKMQSLLADLFQSIATNNEYKINFIIETHSEYLIRKSQVLVANANYADEKDVEEICPFKVYYLPSDAGEPYQMHYKVTGGFVEKFGTGFFDAATESDMVVIRKEFELKKKNRK